MANDKNQNGMVVYEGKSMIDGEQIFVVATGFKTPSKNPKTGEMIQVYIMSKDSPPRDTYNSTAQKESHSSHCGDCKHQAWGTCYVNRFQGTNNVWETYHNGRYMPLDWNAFDGKNVRFGTYGDPAAVPMSVWNKLQKHSRAFTSYTHQWNKKKFQHLKDFCMASVDTPEEYLKATSLGWRTFRVRTEDEKLERHEIACPASGEAGKKTICIKCKGCSGHASKMKRNIAIISHGPFAPKYNKIRKGIIKPV